MRPMRRPWTALLVALVIPAGLIVAPPGAAQARSMTPDVVNGRPPVTGEFTFLAEVRSYFAAGTGSCGGTFVSPTQVISAAHCFVVEGENAFAVEVGPASGRSRPSVRVDASSVEVHEDYGTDGEAHDIALITLEEPIPGVPTATIPTAQQWTSLASAGSAVYSAGWGSTVSGGRGVANFLVADLTILPDAVCSNPYETYEVGSLTYNGLGGSFDEATMICAGGATTDGLPIDTCQGDSGGPLTAGVGSQAVLLGIVSWGRGCAGMEDGEEISLTPGVYTRLSTYLPWLAARGVGQAATKPGAPTNLTVEPVSDTRVSLTWSPPADDGGAAITAYHLQYSLEGGAYEDIGPTVDAEPAQDVINLTPGATYTFRVAAINSQGLRGNFSSPSQPYTMPGARVTRPGEVSDFTLGRFVKKGTSYRVTVSWSAPTDTGGGEITGYVARLGLAGKWGDWVDLTQASTKVTKLKKRKTYSLQVRAVNSAGEGLLASFDFVTPRR